MKITPVKRMTKRLFATVTPGWRSVLITDEWGEHEAHGTHGEVKKLLSRFAKHRLYCTTAVARMRHSTGALHWQGRAWRGRIVSMELLGTDVTVTGDRGSLADSTRPFEDLSVALEWLGALNIGAASFSTMAWNLWRTSLPGSVVVHADPGLGRAALFGGRQELRGPPRSYKHQVSTDIRCAYPHSMGARPFALALAEVDRATRLDPDRAGIARARVFVPTDLAFPPLPVRCSRRLIRFETGWIEGIWPWCELNLAAELGCEVDVTACWAPKAEADLFGNWLQLVHEGRALPGAAARVAKVLSNAAWGQFAMDGNGRTVVGWRDQAGDMPFTVRADNRKLPHVTACHIASEVTARVRVRTTREGIYGPGGAWPIHVDTDGLLQRRTRRHPQPWGDAPGEWSLKATYTVLDARGPQVYRGRCKECGLTHPEWHYKASGVRPEFAPALFERTSPLLVTFGDNGLDTVLPAGNTLERGPLMQKVGAW